MLNFMIMAVFPNVQFKMHQIIMKAPQSFLIHAKFISNSVQLFIKAIGSLSIGSAISSLQDNLFFCCSTLSTYSLSLANYANFFSGETLWMRGSIEIENIILAPTLIIIVAPTLIIILAPTLIIILAPTLVKT